MSHLSEFSNVLGYVKRLLREEVPAIEIMRRGHGRLGLAVRFPLAGTPSLSQITGFYSRLNIVVESSRLQHERKRMHRKFITEAYLAHRAAQYQPRWGTKYHLRGCLAHITKALRLMERSKEYDDDQPVHWSEVYRKEPLQEHQAPEEYWLLLKLKSLLPLLRLSVRILRLILRDCSATWDEWEASLYRREWLQQFILDSRMSFSRALVHAPRRVDLVGSSSLEARSLEH
ncbi:hypothetical protein F5Y12DRAFT_716380 [Xylaria sp. FL1777]|nr:hypothetical protein F5Y12DRAFT_716380 [Xylaria sp. FL1777]